MKEVFWLLWNYAIYNLLPSLLLIWDKVLPLIGGYRPDPPNKPGWMYTLEWIFIPTVGMLIYGIIGAVLILLVVGLLLKFTQWTRWTWRQTLGRLFGWVWSRSFGSKEKPAP